MKKPLFLIVISMLCMASCSRTEYVRITGYAQGGTYSIKCSLPQGSGMNWANEAKTSIDSILNDIDYAVSGYNPESFVSKINNGETIPYGSSPRHRILYELTDYCDSLFLETDGALDTRSAALFDIWGFGFKSGEMPDDEEVAAAKADRGKINFNAVAQGYSADIVGRYLKAQGVENMLVDIGGEIFCTGVNPSGKGWTIGIDAPVDGNMNPGQDIQGTFTIPEGRECGIVTSGNYRKFYIRDGVKYSHTIDPRTGAPVTHNLLSATILAPTSAFADAMATYCMVIGMEEAIEYIDGRDDLEACLISADTVWCSEGFRLNEGR